VSLRCQCAGWIVVLLLWVAVEVIRPKCGYNALCHTQTGPLYGWVLPTVSTFLIFANMQHDVEWERSGESQTIEVTVSCMCSRACIGSRAWRMRCRNTSSGAKGKRRTRPSYVRASCDDASRVWVRTVLFGSRLCFGRHRVIGYESNCVTRGRDRGRLSIIAGLAWC
jgi:hypothetical protein